MTALLSQGRIRGVSDNPRGAVLAPWRILDGARVHAQLADHADDNAAPVVDSAAGSHAPRGALPAPRLARLVASPAVRLLASAIDSRFSGQGWGYPHKAPPAGRGCAVSRPVCDSGVSA